MDEWLDAGADDLQAEQPVGRLVGGRFVMLVARDGVIHAVDGLCPHKFAALADGQLLADGIKCPQHEATFDLATGQPGAGEEWAGRLPVHEVKQQDGLLLVRFSN